MRLGRAPRPPGARFLRLRDHVADLPKAPPSWDGKPGAVFAMYGNDTYGDCTFAAVANHASVQAAAEGRALAFDEQAVIDSYLTHTGGADVGAIEVEVLSRVARSGFPQSGGSYKLRAWAGIEHTDLEELRAAAALFTGAYLGVALPDDWQWGAGQRSWDVTGSPNPDNGHALVLVGYDSTHAELATWGSVIKATWGWMATYLEEAYVLLDEGRLGVDVLGGSGLLSAAADLARQSGSGS